MAHLKYERPDGSEALIFLDATLTEAHRASATVTEHAVETGAKITDHVRPDNDRVSLRFVVSNTPLRSPDPSVERAQPSPVELLVSSPPRREPGADGGLAGPVLPSEPREIRAMVVQWPERFDRIRQVHGELLAIRTEGVLLSIITSLRTYENMAVQALNVSRSSQSGSALEFTLDAMQVRVVSSATAAPRGRRRRPAQSRAKSREANGGQETTAATPETTKRSSVLYRLFVDSGAN